MKIQASQVKTLISAAYAELCNELSAKHGCPVQEVRRVIGSLDDVASELAFAVEITVYQWHKPGIWLDDQGRVDLTKFKTHYREEFEHHDDEDSKMARDEFLLEMEMNKPA